MGIKEFNEVCRGTVMRYTESVLWAFKTLWDKGLIYQGHSIAWYCAHCETPLANNESNGRMYGGDTLREVAGIAVVVTVRLDTGELLRVATEHPWALPGMVAVAVHPDGEYELESGRKVTGALRLHPCAAGDPVPRPRHRRA